jgi:hypothetical protein
MRPEDQLLLSSTRADPLPAPAGPLDYDYLLRQARRHGVWPLLYSRVPALRERLAGLFGANLRHTLLLTRELLDLLDHLQSDGVTAVPFKGPVLAQLAYGDIALRDYGDLDLLLRPPDVLRAKQVLVSRGYRPLYTFRPQQESAHLRFQYEYGFRRDSDGAVVELHWRLAPHFFSFDLPVEALFHRLGTATLEGRNVPALAPEDLVLLLAVHGGRNLWERLAWIADLAAVLRAHPHLDHDRLQASARSLGCRRLLALALALAIDVHDPSVQHLVDQVHARLFQDPPPPPAGILTAARFHLRCRERLGDRLLYCLRLALTPNVEDWARASLSPPTLYYFIRPFRLAHQRRPRRRLQ